MDLSKPEFVDALWSGDEPLFYWHPNICRKWEAFFVHTKRPYVCWNARPFLRLFPEFAPYIYDLEQLCTKASLKEATVLVGQNNVVETEKRVKAYIKAAKGAKLDVKTIQSVVPLDALKEMLAARAEVALRLWGDLVQNSPEKIVEYDSRRSFLTALWNMELRGVKVDVELTDQLLKKDVQPHERKFLTGCQQLAKKDGRAHTVFDARGGKTGRISTAGGFACMAIPHGICRQVVVPTHEAGLIASLDFNAIDYRCIIKAVDDSALNDWYANCDDFHRRSAEFILGAWTDITPEFRNAIKFLTYIHVYGGTVETVAAKTGMSVLEAEKLLLRFDKFLAPVAAFRKKLHQEGVKNGFVHLPGGKMIKVSPDDHEGKVIGLFAQGYSAMVFEEAVAAAENHLLEKKSKLLFPVHDELVVDVHPEEKAEMLALKKVMEQAAGNYHVVNVSFGRNYGEATD